ncbi:MAG TPA: PilZ domain-containing protein [Myxococcota bacterium]|nr:PilZ domain-containing protein [Myxococcota bacterium]
MRLLLEDVGAEFERVRAVDAGAGVTLPTRLLITTARVAHALRLERTLLPSPDRATWIAFVVGDSKTQRNALQKAGFDFLIREPVHPAALRVLLQRALFKGTDSRRAPRVAFGCPVRYRTGFWAKQATLVDLSPRGCRLLMRAKLAEKVALKVELPRELAGGKTLVLAGHAVRVSPAQREGGVAEEYSVGMRFGALNARAQKRLRSVLAERVIGPSALASAVPFTPAEARQGATPTPAATAPQAGAKATQHGDAPPRRKRRQGARARYRKQVTALAGDESYMILCLDISAGGMKIEPIEGITVGAKINLAIQLNPPREPVLVEATVLRDEGEGGLALRFDWLSPESRRQLERLVAMLPSIEALHEEARRVGTVLATRLKRSPRPS